MSVELARSSSHVRVRERVPAASDAVVARAAAPSDRAPVRVLIVEDHRLLADALALGLGGRGHECRVAVSDVAEGIVGEAAEWRPALVLLDLQLGIVDGLELIDPLRASGARVLLVTAEQDRARLAAAVALGASGWVTKGRPFEELLAALELAARGAPLVSPTAYGTLVAMGRQRLDEELALKARAASLTPRELEVLEALSSGMTAGEISAQLVVSLGTVRSHIRAILAKLGVSSQLAAVAVARRLRASTGEVGRKVNGKPLLP